MPWDLSVLHSTAGTISADDNDFSSKMFIKFVRFGGPRANEVAGHVAGALRCSVLTRAARHLLPGTNRVAGINVGFARELKTRPRVITR